MDLTGYGVLAWLFEGGEPVEPACVPVEQRIDEDGDGHTDRTVQTAYDARRRPTVRVTDGEPIGKRYEAWTRHKEGAWTVAAHDADGDGVTDDVARFAYKNGHLAVEEYDRDADGTIDARVETTWERGHKVRAVQTEKGRVGWELTWTWDATRLVHLTAIVHLDTPWRFDQQWTYDANGRAIARDVSAARGDGAPPPVHIEQAWEQVAQQVLPSVRMSVDNDGDGVADVHMVQRHNDRDMVIESMTQGGERTTTRWWCKGEKRPL